MSAAEDFLEIDLGKVCGWKGCEADLLDKRPDMFMFADDSAWRAHVLKLFVRIFDHTACLADHRGEPFFHLALREGKEWEERVARDLSDTRYSGAYSLCFAIL